MKLALNKCFGRFHLSKEAIALLPAGMNSYDIERDDPDLIQVVETLGDRAGGNFSKIRIVSVPDTATDYIIDEYDGCERVIYVVNGKLHFA